MTGPSLVLAAAGLVAGLVLLWRLPRVPAGSAPGGAATVSVVVPARDEERSLPRLLASLHAQDEGPLEVIVVDDGSTDHTAAVARGAGARVIAAPPPPPGWLGKPWACDLGATAAAGQRLLFLDADTWLAPDAVGRLLAVAPPDGLLSVQPFHEVRRPYEQLSAVCNVVPVMAAGIGALRPAPSAPVAFGPCLLTTAAALEAAGGFGAVAGEVVEDAALARAYRRAGLPVHCRTGGDAVRFRMYPDGLRSLVEGWTKNLAGGARLVRWPPLLGALAWVSGAMAVTAAAAATWAFAAAYALYAAQSWWALRRLGSFHPMTAVAFPVPLLAFVTLFLWSSGRRVLGRPVRWRGRAIDPRRGTIR